MNKQRLTKFLAPLATVALLTATVTLAGCSSAGTTPTGGADDSSVVVFTSATETTFVFEVEDLDGNLKTIPVATTATTVGQALQEEGLISGEDGPYGLYVKTVDGTTLDFDKDHAYWAFYVNGEYATKGIDQTPVTEGDTYCLKAEK